MIDPFLTEPGYLLPETMSRTYVYDPPNRPVVGGYSATFDAKTRNWGRKHAIEATKRILHSEPYEPTGDIAFDIRAKAFRDTLLKGTSEAFEESYEGFMAIGLYSHFC